ncbi:MAG: CDP-glycerol glycerophosphotransferase family protein [Candidatus Omnitrophica bacterium]|nr:CDP-glycerol glycerophosphotransferase family protein [Candidatus Omnitrophota bacterium]
MLIERGRIPYSIARKLKWDLIIFPDHGPYFREECPKIYVSHGISSGKQIGGGHYIYGKGSKDSHGNMLYEKIFMHSNLIKEQVRAHYPEFYDCVKIVGSLTADELLEKSRNFNREEELLKLNLDPSKKTIMIASSWGPYCLIQNQGEELIEQINRLQDEFNIILSIHLHNFHVENHYEGKNIKVLLERLKKINVYIPVPKESTHLLLSYADVMVTDMTSLGLYYPLLRRPVIFYDNPNIQYSLSGFIPAMREIAYRISDVSNLSFDIVKALEEFNLVVMEKLSERIFSYQGQARERFLEEIYESLNMEYLRDDSCAPESLIGQRSKEINT